PNRTSNEPSARVTAVPWPIGSGPPYGVSRQRHCHPPAYWASRATLHFTWAPSTAAPVYAVAVPVIETVSPSRGEPAGRANATANFGRLYSSTEMAAIPDGNSDWIVIWPSRRPSGAM